MEWIDFDEIFASIAHLESVCVLLAIANHLNFKLYQIDVKSAFLNEILQEEIYIKQFKGFTNHLFPDHMYMLKKAFYDLVQVPQAWYEQLTKYLLDNSFKKRQADRTLFIRKHDRHLLIAQIYVDCITFEATSDSFSYKFAKEMKFEFEMSMISKLNFFTSIQIKQSENVNFNSQFKYVRDMVKKFNI